MSDEELKEIINTSNAKTVELMEKENISEDFLIEVNQFYYNEISYILENIEDFSFLEKESGLVEIYERLLTEMQSKVEEQQEKYKGEVNGDFFDYLLKATLLDYVNKILNTPSLEKKDSEYVTQLKMDYFGKYFSLCESLDITKEFAQELFDNFQSYLVEELNKSEIEMFSGEVDSEENRAFVRDRADIFKKEMTQKYGDKIEEDFLNHITVESGYFLLKTHHAEANPSGVQLAFSEDSTREEVEYAFKEAMNELPSFFKNKNLEDLVDEAMAQIESGEQYNETAKMLMRLEELEEEQKALNKEKEEFNKKEEKTDKDLAEVETILTDTTHNDTQQDKNNLTAYILLGIVTLSIVLFELFGS